jgi:septum formation protein
MSDAADIHPMWLAAQPLILASGSRARFDLLVAAGIPVEVIRAHIDERALTDPLEKKHISPEIIALTLASEKALAVAKIKRDRVTLGADQTLACDGRLLHKPLDRKAAREQLRYLQGRTHQLYSAVAIALNHQTVATFVGIAKLTMRKLSDEMIDCYLDAAGMSVMESVGGYQLEKTGIHLFSKISGEQSTILGLPMLETLRRLRKLELVIS